MRKVIFSLHLYLSLAAAIFVIILAVTGSIIAFETELDHLFHAKLFYVTPEPQPLSLAEIRSAVEKAYPGERIAAYTLARSPDLSYQVDIGKGTVYINEYSGEILGLVSEPDFATSALAFVHSVHIRLTPSPGGSDIGKQIVKWVDVIIVFLLLSGLYLWWRTKRWTLKKGTSGFRFWFDLHNTVGIFALFFLLLLATTGIILGFDGTITPMFYQITGTQPALVYSRQKFTSDPPSADAIPISPDAAIAIAREALPGATPFSFIVPGPNDAYVFRTAYPEDLTSGGRSQVVIDQYTGQVLGAEGSRTGPTGSRIVTTNRALHTGDIFGLLSKTVLSLASLMMVAQAATGVMMWWRRKRRKQTVNPQSAGEIA